MGAYPSSSEHPTVTNGYLSKLLRVLEKKVEEKTPYQRLLMLAGAQLNWLGDYLLDPTLQWSKRRILVDRLWLTGTSPIWNGVIIDSARRSPKRLRSLIRRDPNLRMLFQSARFTNDPILIRYEGRRFKVLDGMHRVVAAILEGRRTISAFVARPSGKPEPEVEPHVVYDLLRAYNRGHRDRRGLIASLRYLRGWYSNVDPLLIHRFPGEWIHDPALRRAIKRMLAHPA